VLALKYHGLYWSVLLFHSKVLEADLIISKGTSQDITPVTTRKGRRKYFFVVKEVSVSKLRSFLLILFMIRSDKDALQVYLEY